MRSQGDFERLTKKEALMLSRKIDRLEMLLGGIRNMIALPDMVFVVDVRREATAIHESNLLNIPVIGMVDTNGSLPIDFVIPSNDDAIPPSSSSWGNIADAVRKARCSQGQGEDVDTIDVAPGAWPPP